MATSAPKPQTFLNGTGQTRAIKIGDYNFETVGHFFWTDNSYDNENCNQQSLFQLTKAFPLRRSDNRVIALTVHENDLSGNKKNCEQLSAFKKKILRRISGPIHEDARFLSLNIHEIYKRYCDHLVLNKIRHNGLRWVGHLIRMSADEAARKIYKKSIYGRKRRHSRPCLIWNDGVG